MFHYEYLKIFRNLVSLRVSFFEGLYILGLFFIASCVKFAKYSLREKCPNTLFLLVCIFPHPNWIRRDTEYMENTDQKKLRNWILFTQCILKLDEAKKNKVLFPETGRVKSFSKTTRSQTQAIFFLSSEKQDQRSYIRLHTRKAQIQK